MRRAGILVHPTALPGDGPCGDLGPGAIRFLDWLKESGCTVWQLMPLNPPGGGFSPYDSPSAFASGTHLLSLQRLAEDGLLDAQDPRPPKCDPGRVDPGLLESWHRPLAEKAAARLAGQDADALDRFAEEQPWVRDWALYRALLQAHGVHRWQDLPTPLRRREPQAIEQAEEQHKRRIDTEIALQLLFRRQWDAIRQAAHERGIRLVGDVPIFVSAGGADVWAGRHRFKGNQDEDGRWRADPVAGVPPDYFSETGQLWGNPHYDWAVHEEEGYSWWIDRFRNLFSLVDEVRVDHFRGFVAAWEVPAGDEDATGGKWAPGPGKALFDRVRQELGEDLPILVEDLGEITDDVLELRDSLRLPGMKVLQFAFDGDPDNPFLPHNYPHPDWFVYTGTHDNDTSLGWYRNADEATRHRFRLYVARSGENAGWTLTRLAWSSIARTAITQLQDVLGLGSEARFNTPGQSEGNWTWRASRLPSHPETAQLRDLSEIFGRLPRPPKEDEDEEGEE